MKPPLFIVVTTGVEKRSSGELRLEMSTLFRVTANIGDECTDRIVESQFLEGNSKWFNFI